MKQFGDVAKAKAAAERRKRIETGQEADDTVYAERLLLERKTKFRYPGEGAMAYLSLIQASVSTELEAAGGLINFTQSLMLPADAVYLGNLLLDHESGFDIYDLMDLVNDLAEEWSGNPSRLASDSAPTPPPTGRRSTASSRRVVKTPSTSASPAS